MARRLIGRRARSATLNADDRVLLVAHIWASIDTSVLEFEACSGLALWASASALVSAIG